MKKTVRLALLIVGVLLILLGSVSVAAASLDMRRGREKPDVSAGIDMTALRALNPDIVGWLTVDGTGIDFPVLQDRAVREEYVSTGRVDTGEGDPARRLYKYLYTDYTGEDSRTGSITLDYRYDLTAPYVVIHGHNAGSRGVMFSDLKSFEDEAFFEAHRSALVYTDGGERELTLQAVAVVDATSGAVYGNDSAAAAKHIGEHALFGEVTESDGYVLLSTCYAGKDSMERLVLLYGMI